ncbi:MAG: hypothetical protein HZB09_01555 [Candidatus Yonathbacteria bacterium]|nr:hypothetical protein [Candidatus Yonathbacteria bacterium]
MSANRLMAEIMAEHVEENTPLEGNICKSKECGGEIVAEVSSLFRGKFYYSIPKCIKCGRGYIFAKNVRTVGEKEFREMLNQPFTI